MVNIKSGTGPGSQCGQDRSDAMGRKRTIRFNPPALDGRATVSRHPNTVMNPAALRSSVLAQISLCL